MESSLLKGFAKYSKQALFGWKGLGLKLEDLSEYDTPLVGFKGKVVMPEGQNQALSGNRG